MTPRDIATTTDLLRCGLIVAVLVLGMASFAAAQADSTSDWKILETNSEVEFTGATIFSLATTLFIDAAGQLWDTWDTSLLLTPYRLDIINSRREPIEGVRFTDIAYNTDSSGFICGERGVLLQTKNWGRNWKQRYFENLDYLYFYGIAFADHRQGVLCGVTGDENIRVKGILYVTSDGGDTWKEIENIPGTGFSSLSYDPAGERFVITAIGAVLTSDDNGYTWQYVRIPEGQLMRSTILDDDHGLAVGMKGRLLTTQDAGLTWTESKSPTSNNLLALSRHNPGHWYMAGAGGEVWVTRDFGESWKSLGTQKNIFLNGVMRKGPLLFVWGTDGTIMTRRLGRR